MEKRTVDIPLQDYSKRPEKHLLKRRERRHIATNHKPNSKQFKKPIS